MQSELLKIKVSHQYFKAISIFNDKPILDSIN